MKYFERVGATTTGVAGLGEGGARTGGEALGVRRPGPIPVEEELGLRVAVDERPGDAGERGDGELRRGDVQRPVDRGAEALRAVPEGFLDPRREG
ncbi:hypothetical protein [Streptomyces sp. NPDC004042]|uniref:hypothetical protein n=1 Tax=Streptomyces sp. NPDC004042 TaxID=3154451 RepID=UPI0033ABD62C